MKTLILLTFLQATHVFADPKVGAYRVHIGASAPTFENQSKYEKFYGDSSWMPQFSVEHFFFDWYATLGFRFGMGYYRDNGNAVLASNAEKDPNGEIDITMIPLSASVVFQITPFDHKWIVLSGWSGYEYAFFEEVRLNETEDEGSEADDEPSIRTSGWRSSSPLGLALSFNISDLDRTSVSSMEMIGIQAVYVTTFMEYVTSVDNEPFNFARTSYGLAFSFETL